MRFFTRSRKSANGSSTRSVQRTDAPETLIDSWKRGVEKDEAPPHCLSFITKGKKKNVLDDDYEQSQAPRSVRDAPVAGEYREEAEGLRDPAPSDPTVVAEMKEQTLSLVNKESFSVGNLPWDLAEEKLDFWTNQKTEESVHLSIIILDRMMEEHEKATVWSDSQMMYWLKAMIKNWNQAQREVVFSTFFPNDMIEQVEAWETSIDLDAEIYSMLIDGAACSEPHLADSLLRRIAATQRKGLIYSHTYNQVITAWVDAGDPFRAESLLDFMMGEWHNTEGGTVIAAKPNRQSYHWVLLGWANSNESIATERTEAILEKMQKYSRSGTLPGIKPNLDTYKWALNCLLKAPNRKPEDTANRAQSILNLLLEKAARGEEDFRPTADMYSVVIAAWGEAGDPDCGEELLQHLYQDYCKRDQDPRLKPTLEIFNNLLFGWTKVPSKSQRKHACERAEAILDHMKKLSNAGILPDIKPDLKSYNIVLECWSRLGDGKKAQDLLERMIDRWETGDDTIAPDTASYSRVLSAWNRNGNHERCEYITNILHKQFCDLGNYRVHPNLILCGLAKFGGQPDALRRAKTLFQKCDDLSRSGQHPDLKPSRTTYQHLLECVVKADREQGGTQAEQILDEMLEKCAAGDETVKPDVRIYNLVIQALVKTCQPKRTEEVLGRMYAEDLRGARVYPNLETFNTILFAWAKSGLGDEACKRAEQILRRLERIHESKILQNVKPNVVSYNHVLECLVQIPKATNTTSNQQMSTAGERAEAIYKRMLAQNVEPNTITYNRVIVALKNSGNTKRAKQMLKGLKEKTLARVDEASAAEMDASEQWFSM